MIPRGVVNPGRVVVAVLLLLDPGRAAAQAAAPEYGTFVRLLDAPSGAFDQISEALPGAMIRAGWQVVADRDVATSGCRYRGRVFVLQDSSYAAEVLKAGVEAAFALPLRVAVYEDETGTHLAAANPQSVGRTIVAEGFEQAPAEVVGRLRAALADGVPGSPVLVQYGQLRSRGLISKTMGVVAGGPFSHKVREAASRKAGPGTGVTQVAEAIARSAGESRGRWGLKLVYRLELPGLDAVLLGFSGDPVEAKAFAILGEGRDPGRKGYACPGLDHAAAFPIEVLVAREGASIRALLIDEMFRMKIYFEDAGNLKFAANMRMPGSIEDELRDIIEEAL